MASLEPTASGNYHIYFRFQGRRYKRSLKTKCEAEANARCSRLDETIRLVESGRIELPDGADLATFLLSDGKLAIKTLDEKEPNSTPPVRSKNSAEP